MDLLQRRRELMDRLSAAGDPYLLQPFTINVTSAFTLAIARIGSSTTYPLTALSIKKNNGNWENGVWDSSNGVWLFGGEMFINANTGDTLQIKGNNAWGSSTNDGIIMYCGGGTCTLSGNINSLVCGDNFTTESTIPNYALSNVFSYSGYGFNNAYTDISNLRLPATNLGTSCYYSLFKDNTHITTAPELPATILANNCYQSMFSGCSYLTTAPILPATTLVTGCYYGMFARCTHLSYVKAMFLAIPNVFVTMNWLNGVASTGTFVKNSAATWTTTGANGVPNGWTIQYADS